MPFGLTASSVGHEVFLLTFTEPNIALCQRERQSKRQAGEAVIQSEVLRISPGSSSFSNYPPGGILAVLDNNGSPGVRLSPLKCGWRKPTRGAGQRNVCFSVMSFEEHNTKALVLFPERERSCATTLIFFCLTYDTQLGIFSAVCDVIMKHVL